MKRSFFIIVTVLVSVFFLITLSAKETRMTWAPVSTNSENIEGSMHLETIILGSGCFWGAEKRYEAIPGVIDAVSGYANGKGVPATYRAITQRSNKFNPNNHAEVVKVTYNSTQVSLEEILQSYFENHDPTQVNRQGNDIGTQYRSTILTQNENQVKITNQLLNQYQILLSAEGYGKIATIVEPLENFTPAENYHQDYLKKNPNGYCPDHSTGVTFEKAGNTTTIDNSNLLTGKQIVVIEAPHCPYCEKFKKDVADPYGEFKDAVGITFRLASQLEGFSIKTPTWATPTILFLKDGKEILGHQGYMNPEEFQKALILFHKKAS